MTSDRPYRKAMSHEEAIAILKAEKGKQFHPQAVDALLKVLEKIKK
jgi:HD-GYP domain-containing protein (c-di-GMP phosphodiesterase class II)